MSDEVLEFRKPEASLRKDRDYEPRECRHHHITIKERPRRLRCRDCKKEIDPFEYVLGLAEAWERLFPKNEAARELETALDGILSAHGTITINDSGVTARQLTANGAKLEAHESWGAHAWNGGVAAAIVQAVKKLSRDAARWGAREVAYPRMTIVKRRGEQKWEVGVLSSRGGWYALSHGAPSIDEAYDIAKREAERLEKPLIIEDRPRRLWR